MTNVLTDPPIYDIANAADQRETDGAMILVRNAQKVMGSALIFSCIGVWLLPGMSWEPDIALIKMLVSLTMGFAGIGLLQEGRIDPAPEIEIDLIRREVRVVQRAGRNTSVLTRHGFEDLGKAEDRGGSVRLHDQNGEVLADVPVHHADVRRVLVSALSRAGKLVPRSQSVQRRADPV